MSAPPNPLLFDTDIGGNVDDALALALALASPELDLRAVSVVSGDVELLDLRARIASRLLGLAGRRDIPVLRGIPRPSSAMDRDRVLSATSALLDGDADAPILDTPATDWLREASLRERLHVVATGPFTTVAGALHKHPNLSTRVQRLTVMGGMVDKRRFPDYWRDAGAGAELDYNSQCDPGAALACARSGVPMTWVPIEVTLHTQLTRIDLARLQAAATPFPRALARLAEVWGERHFRHREHGQPDAVANLHDPLAMACLLPQSSQWLTVATERLEYGIEAGLLTTKPAAAGDQHASTARVATHVDAPAFAQFYVDRILAAFG